MTHMSCTLYLCMLVICALSICYVYVSPGFVWASKIQENYSLVVSRLIEKKIHCDSYDK